MPRLGPGVLQLQSEREHRIKEDVSTIKRTFFCQVPTPHPPPLLPINGLSLTALSTTPQTLIKTQSFPPSRDVAYASSLIAFGLCKFCCSEVCTFCTGGTFYRINLWLWLAG